MMLHVWFGQIQLKVTRKIISYNPLFYDIHMHMLVSKWFGVLFEHIPNYYSKMKCEVSIPLSDIYGYYISI